MAVPKKRKSKQKSRQVKAGQPKIEVLKAVACSNCGSPKQSHRACGNCGYYNGRIYKLAKMNKDSASEEAA